MPLAPGALGKTRSPRISRGATAKSWKLCTSDARPCGERLGDVTGCGSDREDGRLAPAQSLAAVGAEFTALEDTDVVRRFVKLLDLLYDQRRRLIVSCEAPLDEIFQDIRNEARRSNGAGGAGPGAGAGGAGELVVVGWCWGWLGGWVDHDFVEIFGREGDDIEVLC
eukprot:Skav208025  [mRNA]  locus=scaffold2714:424093:428871:- [translate_table: standard]